MIVKSEVNKRKPQFAQRYVYSNCMINFLIMENVCFDLNFCFRLDMLDIFLVRYFLFYIIYQILLSINKIQSFFNTGMEKGKPNNTRNHDLEKIKMILEQCCQAAKNTVDRIIKFRQSNKQQRLLKGYSNVYSNFYEHNLLSRVYYRELQSSCQKVMQFAEELLEQIWNEKKSLIKSMKSCLEEINKCSNLVKSEHQYFKEFHRGYKLEDGSKTKCVQYLSLIHQSIVYQTEKLQVAQNIMSKIQQSQSQKKITIVEQNYMNKSSNLSQDQNQVLTGVKNIIEKIITETETFCTKQLPKISFYQLKKNRWYVYLKSICQEMLKITVDIMNSGFKFSQWLIFHTELKRIIAERNRICEEIMKEKYLFGDVVEEIKNHLYLIQAKFQEIDSFPNRIKKLSGTNQEIWDILESAADIKFGLDPILGNDKNTNNQDCYVKLKILFLIRDKSTFIQQKTMKLLDEIGSSEYDYNKREDTVKTQNLYTCRQVDKKVKIKLDEFRDNLQRTHKKQMQELQLKYKQQIQQLQRQINAQKLELDSKDSKLKTFQNQNSQNEVKFNQLSKQIQAKNTIIDKQNRRLQQLTAKKDQAQNQMKLTEVNKQASQQCSIPKMNQLEMKKNDSNVRKQQSTFFSSQKYKQNKEIVQWIPQLSKQKLKTQKPQIELVKQYENQIKLFQEKANQEINEFKQKFKSLNEKTVEDRNYYITQYQKALRSSQHNSACLNMIYRAMKKMNEIYNKQSSQKQIGLQRKSDIQKKQAQKYLQNSEQKINLKDNQQQQILTEEQGKNVIVYSIKTLKVLESVIQLRDQKNQANISSTIQQNENKMHEVIKVIEVWNNTDTLRLKLKSSLNKENKVSKGQPINSIEKLQFTFSTFVNKIADFVQSQQKKANEKIDNVDTQKNQIAKELQQQKIALQNEHYNTIKLKDNLIQEINQKLQKAQSQYNSSQKNAEKTRFQDLQKLKRQNQSLKKQKQYSLLQNETKYKAKKQELLNLTEIKNLELSQLSRQLQASKRQVKDLQAALQQQNEKLKKNQQDSKQQKSYLQKELSKKDIELIKIKSQLQLSVNKLKQIETKFNITVQQLSSYKNESTINNHRITKLQQKLNQSITQKQILQTNLSAIKSQHKNQLSDLNLQINELNISLGQKQQECIQSLQQLSQFKEICMNVHSVLGKKLKKQINLHELANEIQNYNPSIGMKLIVSHIMHGNDTQRSQIIATIERFSKKTIKRTEFLCRYPDAKSITYHLKDATNFAFIMIYKTVKGTIFGSYSEGLRKTTFIFSFTPSGQDNTQGVRFYIPENPSVKIPSVELFQTKYLQYGACQLRLNCLELATITAKSDVNGGNYYGLNWREVMNENNQEKVPLCEVELHKIQFEVQVTNEKEQSKI